MIVPSTRLLFWVAVVVLPFAMLGAMEPAAAVASLCLIGALLGLAAIDAFGARASLAGISVLLPQVARMSKDRPAKLEVRVRNERLRARTLRVGLVLPAAIQSPEQEALVSLPAGSEWSRFEWLCVPQRRGNHRLETVCLETASPWGFWLARRRAAATCELRVYPNLLTERRNLASLFLHRGTAGLHAHRQIGQGREFEKLREYIPGDSFEEIHWKATAKRSRPVTKVFQLERTQEVYVVIDNSRLSGREVETRKLEGSARNPASPGMPSSAITLERYLTAALVLGLAAEQQGDLFGLVTFSNQIRNFVRAKNGKTHYSACRDALYLLQPEMVTPDYDEICSFIRLRLRRRSLLVFLTALDDPVLAESFVRNVDLIRRQHLVLVNMIPPTGVAPLFSDPNVNSVDDLYEKLGGHMLWQNLNELAKVLQRRGVKFSLLENERLSAGLVSQYLEVKRRQML